MNATDWDTRYREADLLWSQGPNMWVEQVAGELEPGRVLDLAAGEGRNAIWLAERGWSATAVDFSKVALDRAGRIAEQRLGAGASRLTTQLADVLAEAADPRAFDLVLVVYLQLVAAERRKVLRDATEAVAEGGHLLIAAHDSDNIEHGYGGPSDPAVLYSAADIVADIEGTGIVVERAEQVTRVVATAEGERRALDCLVVASRPTRAELAR
jgi:SAM-dependent methyltransferase